MNTDVYAQKCQELGITQSLALRPMPAGFVDYSEPAYIRPDGHHNLGPRIQPYELEDMSHLNPKWTAKRSDCVARYWASMTKEQRDEALRKRRENGKIKHAEKIKHK